jgi:putative hemolysin
MIALILTLAATLILVNALYVAAEFAAVSVRRNQLRLRAEEGDRLARSAWHQIATPARLDDFVACCQVGITLSSLALGAFGQAQLAPRLAPLFGRLGDGATVAAHSTAAVVVLVVLTAVQMILGELVPKSLALQAPLTTIRWTALPLRVSSWVLTWFVRFLNGSGHLVLRAVGHEGVGHAHLHSPEEIELLVTESSAAGAIEPQDARRLRRALQLRLRRARHLMTPRPQVRAIDADLPVDELVRAVLEGAFTRYPVYRGDRENILGIIHSRDVAARVIRGEPIAAVDEVLRPAVAVPETMPAEDLVERIREAKAMQLVVLDEYGGLAGIVSASDLLREVLGEVPDDFGGAPLVPLRLPDGRVRLPGRLPLDRAARWTGVRWDSEADTVAGAILEALGGVPTAGQRVTLDGLEVEVERVEQRAVVSVLSEVAAEVRPG